MNYLFFFRWILNWVYLNITLWILVEIFESLKKIIKASLKDENVDLIIDVFGN